jgi:putative aldouronate transport system substrate-binding protein
MPETTDDFKNTLIAFRDRIPPVNGQRIIPYSASPNNLNVGAIAGWFGVNAFGYFAMMDGRLEITITRPEYKEFLKYFADLYANGLVDQELFSQDEQSYRAKGRQGLYGAAYSYQPSEFAPQVRNDNTVNQYDYEALPVLRAPGVTKPTYRRATDFVVPVPYHAVITDNAKNPLTIIRWFDNLYDETNSLAATWGPLGIRFEQLPDGTYRETPNGRSLEAREEASPAFFGSMPRFVRPGTRVQPPEGMGAEYSYTEVRDALYEPYLDQMIPFAWSDERTGQQISQLTQAIGFYYDQKMAEWITGQADIESQWDTYLADLDNLGINELLEIRRGLIENR